MGSTNSRPPSPSTAYSSSTNSREVRFEKRKKKLLSPFVRSVSCGFGASSWKTESVERDDATGATEYLYSASIPQKPVAARLTDRNGEKSLDAGTSSISNLVQGSNSRCISALPDDSHRDASAVEHNFIQDSDCFSVGNSTNAELLDEHGISDTPCSIVHIGEHTGLSATVPMSETGTCSSLEALSRNLSTSEMHSPRPQSVNGRFHVIGELQNEEPLTAARGRQTYDAQRIENFELPSLEAQGSIVRSSNGASSNILHTEALGREARRNSRRSLWDALSRVTSRRRALSPAFGAANQGIHRFTHRYDSWGFLDRSNSVERRFAGEGGFLISRAADLEETRQRIRSQMWALQHFSGGTEGTPVHSRNCATQRNPRSQCSCEASLMSEETSTRASISRIVMLAEALFEVLDEIHRQSVAFSRSSSLSLVLSPAPEAIVDSFPLHLYKKSLKVAGAAEEPAECYICLIEYEDGELVRTLPCCHEFHKICIDKWLKEVHSVCPLCRGNVCDAAPKNC